jgi:hypothetical protein
MWTNYTQVFVSRSSEIDWPMLWIWVRESCLWKFTIILKLGNKLWFFVKCYSIRFKIKLHWDIKLSYEIKITFGEISKLCETNWNVARINVIVVANELPSQITVDIWTRRRRHTSTQFYALQCHPPKMAGFYWNWHQKFSTLLWTPLACWKALSESYATHTISS